MATPLRKLYFPTPSTPAEQGQLNRSGLRIVIPVEAVFFIPEVGIDRFGQRGGTRFVFSRRESEPVRQILHGFAFQIQIGVQVGRQHGIDGVERAGNFIVDPGHVCFRPAAEPFFPVHGLIVVIKIGRELRKKSAHEIFLAPQGKIDGRILRKKRLRMERQTRRPLVVVDVRDIAVLPLTGEHIRQIVLQLFDFPVRGKTQRHEMIVPSVDARVAGAPGDGQKGRAKTSRRFPADLRHDLHDMFVDRPEGFFERDVRPVRRRSCGFHIHHAEILPLLSHTLFEK